MNRPINIFLPAAFVLASLPSFGQVLKADAGPDTGYCPGDSVTIGGNPAATGGTPPYTYSWSPATNLDNAAAPNPSAFPATPTTYVLTVTDGSGATATDAVYVTNYTTPLVSAGNDQTIVQGTATTLNGSGAVNYFWTPTGSLTNQNTASPLAEPASTNTFCVVGVDANGCYAVDCMVLTVTPSDTIITYNTFTPNGDGFNDLWHIGNLGAFPDNKLEIYSRNGKLVYQASPYQNDWNGKIEGDELPAATYYFIFYPGTGAENVQGTITIIR